MSKTYISSIGTAVPPYKISQEESVQFMGSALHLDENEQRKLNILYRATSISQRFSVLDDFKKKQDFTFYVNGGTPFPSTARRMQVYQKHAATLGIDAIQDCLRLKPGLISEISHLITISCTGMYAPGLDIELIDKLGLASSIQRTCVNFMGCYAAFNALKIADYICKSEPDAKVLVVGVELCTIHLQNSTSEDDLMANALFADGASAVLLEAKPSFYPALSLDAFYCGLASQGKNEMAWKIEDQGFGIRLSSYIPDLLKDNIRFLVHGLLDKLNLRLEEIQNFAIHPGGKKILESVEKSLEISRDKNMAAYETLKNFGNMSSVTILFVLKNIMQKLSKIQDKEKILAMAFGPGLTLESALFKIHYEGS